MREPEHESAPRGRHAPPLEVRQDRQRRRLYAAAGAVFAHVGYADATAEAIAREAGMSKATFYEHFDNKEDCIVALHDDATRAVLEAMRRTGDDYGGADTSGRVRAVIHTFLDAFAIVGAVVGLASRQIRHGEPEDVRDLEPVVERLVLGLLRTSSTAAAA